MKIASVSLALYGVFAFPLTSWGACTPPSPVTVAGSTVACAGSTSGQYLINAQNVAFTNSGSWTATGALLGVIYATQNLANGVSVINQGSIDWANALYGGSGTGTRSVANVGYTTGNNFTSASFLNETGASISASITSNLAANRYISGASLYTINGPASLINRGTISITNNSTTPSSGSDGIDALGRSATVVNEGTVGINIPGGAGAYGLTARATAGAADVTNSGSVTINGVGASAAAVSTGLSAGTTELKITNNGLLELKGGTSTSPTRRVIELSSLAGNTIVQQVENLAGGIIRADAFSHAIMLDGSDAVTNSVKITNNGSIEGPILTRAGSDTLIQAAGQINGNVNFGAGADNLQASGGEIIGSISMGDGNDVITLSGDIDVTQVPLFDGGAGADQFNIDGISLRAFTASANNPSLGANLTLWETVDVQNGGALRLTGDLFDSANTGILKLSNAAAALDLQDSVTTTNTIHGNFDSVGVVKVDTVAGDSSSASDVLHITGSTAGTTELRINNLGGAGALTTGNGILVVQVDGSSSGAFALPGGSLIVGQFIYSLQKIGSNWYLQSQANTGTVQVTKTVVGPEGAPAFSGSIPFTLTCASPDFTQQGSIAVANNVGTTAPLTVAAGSTCSVTEGALPVAPLGYQWGTALLPAATEPLPVGGNLTLAITNTLIKQSVPAALPTPVPSLSQWALALLSLVLGGCAVISVRRTRMH